jgi:hypothetical protein
MSEKSANILTRADLENLFKDGKIPAEADFKSLIDSMINILDDGFSKTEKNGFEIKLTDQKYQRFISFFKDRNDFNIFFSVEKSEDASCIILKPGMPDEDTESATGFYFGKNGSLGIGKKAQYPAGIDVNGFAAMKGRMGTYKPAVQVEEALADGKWHTIIPHLDHCNGFEIIARVGIVGTGKFAMMHAIALATFGRAKGRIRKTSSHYGFFWNKLTLRWKANDTHDYSLQIKTRSNYGNGAVISYKITQLWDDKLFNEKIQRSK